MAVTYYVALPFTDSKRVSAGLKPLNARAASGAISAAQMLAKKQGNVGALAFSRTGDRWREISGLHTNSPSSACTCCHACRR